jgi:hypothetical protein
VKHGRVQAYTKEEKRGASLCLYVLVMVLLGV